MKYYTSARITYENGLIVRYVLEDFDEPKKANESKNGLLDLLHDSLGAYINLQIGDNILACEKMVAANVSVFTAEELKALIENAV